MNASGTECFDFTAGFTTSEARAMCGGTYSSGECPSSGRVGTCYYTGGSVALGDLWTSGDALYSGTAAGGALTCSSVHGTWVPN